MTDILPNARQEIVPGQAMSPVWFNALRLMARSIKQGASGIVDVQAQLAPVLAALRTATGEILNIADALAGKLDATTSMKTLAKLTGSGFVRKSGNTWSASDPLASEISYDNSTSGLAAETLQAAVDEVAASSGPADTDALPEGVTNLYFTDERAQDAIAALIAAGTHSGISFSYNDAGNALSATVSGGGATTDIRDIWLMG